MTVVFKDIELLTQKSSLAGTEKVVVSDTQYITPQQITEGVEEKLDSLIEKVDLSELTEYKNQINSSTNKWVSYYSSDPDAILMIPITPSEKYMVVNNYESYNVVIAVLNETTPHNGQTPVYATGYSEIVVVSPGDSYDFIAPLDAQCLYMRKVTHAGTYVLGELYHILGLSDYEQVSNKVTSLSSQSTNTQYPSAKCVYDALAEKQSLIDSTHKLDYSLVDNTPTIPTVNDSTITLQMNGATVDTFTTNTASNKTINLGGNYPKYVLCADEAEYTAIATKDSGTLYLIPET